MDNVRELHYKAFCKELVALCEKFSADNLQASIATGMVVAQFGPRGEVVAYDRSGEVTVIAADGSEWMNRQLAVNKA